jgi:flavin-dependent dehydrogenase
VTHVSMDVCVIGGGPAGTSAALRLALLGYRVALIDRGDNGTRRDESVTPSISPLLDGLGLKDAVAERALLRPAQKCLLWTGYEESTDHADALLIDRRCFDRFLLDAAADAGVRLFRPASARRLAATEMGWVITVDAGISRLNIDARILVDARGRCRSGSQSGTPTVALCGTWRTDVVTYTQRMFVDVVPNGWIWAATRPDRSIRALAFLDAQYCRGLGPRDRENLYRSMIAHSNLLGPCRLTELLGDIAVRDSTWRAADQVVTAQSIKVGDRAYAMDPLSSQGVQSALRSGIQAGAVIHTILSGGDVAAAIQFYRESQEASIAHHQRVVASAYAAQRLHRTPFWTMRSRGASRGRNQPRSVAVLRSDAFVRLAANTRVVDVPVIDGNSICRQPALVHPSLDRPVAWLGGTPMSVIVRAARSRLTVSELLSGCAGQSLPASARDAICWLIARGVLTTLD